MMPFELMNAPSTFQRMIDAVLKYNPFEKAYMDHVVTHPKNMDKHMAHLQKVLDVIDGDRLF